MACSEPFTYSGWIVGIDLEKLELVTSFNVSVPIGSVVEGPGKRLYARGFAATVELYADTGAVLTTAYDYTGQLASRQGVLYLGLSYGAGLRAYDISQAQMQL